MEIKQALAVPLFVLLISLAAGACHAQTTRLSEDPAALREEFGKEDVQFQSYIFSGTDFPTCDFSEPRAIVAMIGPYTISTTFHDADFQPVTSADKPGRYGAIVDVAAGDHHYKRFATLFRTVDDVNWRTRTTAAATLPGDLGIGDGILAAQSDAINDFATDTLIRKFQHDSDGAVLLAWLAQSNSGPNDSAMDGPYDARTTDQKYWFELWQRTGNLEPLQYLTYLPTDYDSDKSKKYPILLALHGSAEVGGDLDLVKTTPIPRRFASVKDPSFIVIVPVCPPRESGWNPWKLNALLDEVCTRYRADPDRIYMTGYSLGGYGAWSFACVFPHRLGAIAPLCGWCRPSAMHRLVNLPIWAFHGEKDQSVSIGLDRKCIAELKRLGSHVKFTVYPDLGHAIWTPTYANEELYSWFLQQRR